MEVRGKLLNLADVELNLGHRLASDLVCFMVAAGNGYRILTAGEGLIEPSSYPGGTPDTDTYLLGQHVKVNGGIGLAYDAAALGLAQNFNTTGWAAGFGMFRESSGTDWIGFIGQRKPDDSDWLWSFYRQGYGASNEWRFYFNGANSDGCAGLLVNEYTTNIGTAAPTSGSQNFCGYVDGIKVRDQSAYWSGGDFSLGGKLLIGVDKISSPTAGNIVAFLPWFGFWGRQLDGDDALASNDILFDDSTSAFLLTPKHATWHFLAQSGGGGTSPVSNTRDLRWNVAVAVARQADLRWSDYAVISALADLRWNDIGRIVNAADLRWHVRQLAAALSDLRWDDRALASSPADLRWNVANLAAAQAGARWNDYAIAARQADLRWNAIARVAAQGDLRWNINLTLQAAANQIDIRWNVRNVVSRQADTRWHVFVTALNSLDLRWDDIARVVDTLVLTWNDHQGAARSVDTQWAVRQVASQQTDVRWDDRAAAARSLQTLWDVTGRVAAARDLRWIIANIVAKQVEARWADLISAGAQFQMVWHDIAAAGKTVTVTWSIVGQIDTAKMTTVYFPAEDRSVTFPAEDRSVTFGPEDRSLIQ